MKYLSISLTKYVQDLLEENYDDNAPKFPEPVNAGDVGSIPGPGN